MEGKRDEEGEPRNADPLREPSLTNSFGGLTVHVPADRTVELTSAAAAAPGAVLAAALR
jgi:hypothetical protein